MVEFAQRLKPAAQKEAPLPVRSVEDLLSNYLELHFKPDNGNANEKIGDLSDILKSLGYKTTRWNTGKEYCLNVDLFERKGMTNAPIPSFTLVYKNGDKTWHVIGNSRSFIGMVLDKFLTGELWKIL